MNFPDLPSNHFLTQPRPDPFSPQPAGVVDTTTLAAHDFDVDSRTSFMPPQPPLARLPVQWEIWESHLDAAVSQGLQLAERVERLDTVQKTAETDKSKSWRGCVAKMSCLSIEELKHSERALRRAHLVLAWLLHFYVHTVPSVEPLVIPRSLTIPLLQISRQLQLPPTLTYSDTALYNWAYKESYHDESTSNVLPTIHNIRSQTSFTGTTDEAEFHLTSARVELQGAEVLELMRLSMDEVFINDDITIRRITGYLERMAVAILELREVLLSVKETVDPDVFYHQIRPWLRGVDGDPSGRPCIFEGREEVEGWTEMPEVSGTSAGQSSLFQALDIYLGVDAEAPQTSFMPHPSKKSFQERMRAYMPRHHRGFLNHLRGNSRAIRAFVQKATEEGCDFPILAAYNAAVKALKEFRDAHMIVVTLFIISPARRASKAAVVVTGAPLKGEESKGVKGTGGTDLAKFLKGVRDQTSETYLPN